MDIVTAAKKTTIDTIVAYIAANPGQTEAQACYLTKAVDVLDAALGPCRALPVGQRPYIALSSEVRSSAVRRLFAIAVEEGRLVCTGWRAGYPTYEVA